MIIYNLEPAEVDLYFVQGDTINLPLTFVDGDGDPYVMTGFQIDMAFKRFDDLQIKKLSTTTGEISILINELLIFTNDGFDERGLMEYDLQVIDGLQTYTIMRGKAYIKKEIT